MSEVKNEIYQHYKGGKYRILYEAVNSENKLPEIVYQSLDDEKKIWVRPKEMFFEEVEIDGKKKPRFELIDKESIEESAAEENDWEAKYMRALADYQNLLKQGMREKEEFIKYALSDFLQDILPIYDHLKLSVAGLSEDEAKNPWAIGVGHVLKQFKEVLNGRGIEEIETVGKKFDHELMEALDGNGEIVKQEVMPGYRFNGRVIRHAKVIVG